MKCAKCGAELKLGCIYCSVCGQEAQIVSESTLLEEELLRDLLKEESRQPVKKESVSAKSKTGTQNGKNASKKSKQNHRPLIITLTCLVVLIVVGVILFTAIRQKNNNSFSYQMEMAQQNQTEKNYVKALEYLKRALELEPEDLSARKQMVEIFLSMEEEKKAISMLHEIISLSNTDVESYQKLIALYDKAGDYEAILTLEAGAVDENVLALFATYECIPPSFNMEPGEYADYITVELNAESNCSIYYTTDGTDPIENGVLYEKPFEMKEQSTLNIKAVACNEYHVYSELISGTFQVKFQKPKTATAIPDSGSFSTPTTIELVGSEGSRIFYTWDGSDPTLASMEYTGPIEVPFGNNILSVVVMDKYGMMSDVLKCNYRYFP